MHVSHPVEEYQAGGQAAPGALQIGLSVPPKREEAPRDAGYRPREIQNVYLRQRVLLARTPGMPEVHIAEGE